MRIVLLTSKLNFKTSGGSVMDLHLKAKGLAELGNEVVVVTAFSQANILGDKYGLPYKVCEETTEYRGLLGIQYHVYRILKKYQDCADVFYIDGQIFIYGGGMYRLLGGRIPVVAFFNTRLNCMGDTHGTERSQSRLQKAKRKLRLILERGIGTRIANRVDRFIFNTPMVENIYRAFGYDVKRAAVIEDFVDMQRIAAGNTITQQSIISHQRNQSVLTLFTTGRMIPEKGFDLVVHAFALLKDKDRFHIIMSGGGPDKERLERLVAEKSLQKYFTFPGWVDKETLVRYFTEAHIFIFPKWWIEYGSALLTEALAFGLPCIIPGGGALEWLTLGNVLTFKNDDPAELAARIEEFWTHDELRIRLAQKGLARCDTLDYRVLAEKLNTVVASVTPI